MGPLMFIKRPPSRTGLLLLVWLTIFASPCPASAAEGPHIRWKNHFWGWQPFTRHEFSRPTLSKNYVLIGLQNGTFAALRRADGSIAWKNKFGAGFSTQAAVGGGKVYAADQHGMLHALHLRTGREIWSTQLQSQVRAKPIYGKGLLFVQTLGDEVLALDAKTGKQRWTFSAPPVGTLPMTIPASPVLQDGTLFASFASGVVFSARASDGQIHWQRNLSTAELAFTACASPVLTTKDLVVLQIGRGLFALDAKTGTPLWNRDHSQAYSLAADAEKHTLYMGHWKEGIFAVDSEDGKTLWQRSLSSHTDAHYSELAIFGDWILVGDSHSTLWAVNRKDGQSVQKIDPWTDWGGFPNTPTVRDANAAVWSEHGTLYYLDIR